MQINKLFFFSFKKIILITHEHKTIDFFRSMHSRILKNGAQESLSFFSYAACAPQMVDKLSAQMISLPGVKSVSLPLRPPSLHAH